MGLQVVTAQDQERWIERNTIRCERFDARLSAEACDEIRKRDPDRCLGCRRAKPNEKREPTAFEQSQRKGQERRRKEGYTYKSGRITSYNVCYTKLLRFI